MMRLVVASTDNRIEKIREELHTYPRVAWIFVGYDIERLLQWEQLLGTECERLSLTTGLQEAAASIEEEYLQLIDDLGERYDSLDWWLSQLVEKSHYTSTFFIDICYLRTVMRWLAVHSDKSWLILVEKDVLGKVLVEQAHQHFPGSQIRWLPPPRGVHFRRIFTALIAQFRARVAVVRSWLQIRNLLNTSGISDDGAASEQTQVLLHSWIRAECQDAKVDFRDLYLGVLADELSARGDRIQYLVLPITLVSGWTEIRSIVALLSAKNQIFPVHNYLQWSDIVSALLLPFWVRRLPRGEIFLGGMDVTRLLGSEKRDQAWCMRVAHAYLFFALCKRLAQANRTFERIIFTFENQVWEKALCFGAHKYEIADLLIGFQHTYFPWRYYPYYAGKSELASQACPDRLVSNGQMPARLFRKIGYPDVRVGGALRQKVMGAGRTIRPRRLERPIILVCPSGHRNMTCELLWQVHQAFEAEKRWEVWIKLHPILALGKDVCRTIFNKGLPTHFRFVNDPVEELLQQVDLLIYSTTVVSYEALAHGVPILAVMPKLDIDRDPMRWHKSARRVASTPIEVREQANELLTMSSQQWEDWYRNAREVVADVFVPVSSETIEAFLGTGRGE